MRLRAAFLPIATIVILVALLVAAAPAQTPLALTPQGAPTVMRLCIQNIPKCQTLTWSGDHYVGVEDGERTTIATYVIEQWSARNVRLKGTSLLEYKAPPGNVKGIPIPHHGHMEGVYTGVVASSGDRVEEALVKYHGPLGNGQLAYQLTWKTAKDDIPVIACSAPAASLLAPTDLIVCDGPCITANNKNLGAWILGGNKGKGSYRLGDRMSLAVEQWDANGIVVIREDTPYSSAPCLRAKYSGKACGDTIKGTVTASWPGHVENATGPWTATLAPKNCDAAGDDNQELVETGRQLLFFRNTKGALGCFSRAAALGDTDARTATALMYRDGLGTDPDFKHAREMFEAAAIAQDYNAQLALADMYDLGLGVPRDVEQSNLWRDRAWRNPVAVAARQNREDAKEMRKMLFTGLCAMVEAFSQPTVYAVYR